jgi:hypothetical protein
MMIYAPWYAESVVVGSSFISACRIHHLPRVGFTVFIKTIVQNGLKFWTKFYAEVSKQREKISQKKYGYPPEKTGFFSSVWIKLELEPDDIAAMTKPCLDVGVDQ